ncbi:MAG: hypothetical protein A3H51_01425 [Candidatus Spechtbacteria bacterium RIFCSPLOWO2_02_FULL_38_8]|uniref:Response regulatory domain-containing protein n=1 Tax=Candidatus Spechtbacteria bacterium RIFCSPLOWO2_02_FULL_38_8 TaxID=1802164 RepID=A0A1G2HK22_9BACT|nr:MAG: hypothetical protein A3H51_01425 [Candidatus Spechtbacteria bacterium RIFCSPLOWO2_02_FULL_38_8]
MSKKVLLIENDPFLTGIYVDKFEEAGYAIEVSDNANDGIKKAQEHNPNIIVVDTDVPGMDGPELLHKLSSTNIPIVVFNNREDEVDFKKAKELGAIAYLIKSQYTSNEIVAEVDGIINK